MTKTIMIAHGGAAIQAARIIAGVAASRKANDIIGDANNQYMRDQDPSALADAYYLAAKWHDKQAAMCKAVAEDKPRIGSAIRDKALAAATHHGASAAGLRLAATDILRPTAAP